MEKLKLKCFVNFKTVKNIMLLFCCACFICLGCFTVLAQNEVKDGAEERFRKHLTVNFARLHDGKSIRFNDSRVDSYSKMLAEKMRQFLNERQGLNCQQFYDSCFEYLKNDCANETPVEVLNRVDFENLIKDGQSGFCKLFVPIKSNIFAEEFKKGRLFSDKAKKYVLDESAQIKPYYSQYTYDPAGFYSAYSGLAAFENDDLANLEARVFSEGQLVFPGFVGDIAVCGLNVVDFDFLDEVLAAVEYNNPQEFGLCNEIEKYYTKDNEQRYLKELTSIVSNGSIDLDEYLAGNYCTIIFNIFRRSLRQKSEFYLKKTGRSIDFAKLERDMNFDEQRRISDEFKQVGEQWFDEELRLGFEASQYDNKTLALMTNYGVIAKLLGFDAVKFPDNRIGYEGGVGGYIINNLQKIKAVCTDLTPTCCDKYEVWRVSAGCCL